MDGLTSKQKAYLVLVAVLLALNFFAYRQVIALSEPPVLRVDVLDVGQGDSIFIQTPQRRSIIIDGGPGGAVLEKLSARLPFWERSLDAVILTHPDQDHLMGLLSVLQHYKVRYIIWTGIVRSGANYQRWLQLLDSAQHQGSRVVIARAGTRITSSGATLRLVHPFTDLHGQSFGGDDNDTGVVARLDYGRKSFLFTADVSQAVEQALIDAKAPLAADVLKVGHHGSKYSSGESFLAAVSPGLAAISVGAKNTYGHPTPEVLQRLQNFGIPMLRTDQHGDIIFATDGRTISVK